MNLNDCLRAVENGLAGKEHAEWLRKVHDRQKTHGDGWKKSALLHMGFWYKARADAINISAWASLWKRAAKRWRFDAMQGDELHLDTLGERNEARAWAIRMKQERDKLIQSRSIV